jgi:hypothetical protein
MKRKILEKEGIQFNGDAIVNFEKKRAVLKRER